jgi:methionyl aminopeptidase
MSFVGNLSESDVAGAAGAADAVVETHRRIAAFLRPGLTLAKIDEFVAQTLADLGCRSCFLHYKQARGPKFPSHACLSLNECVVHGTAGYYTAPIKAGDLLKVDIGVIRNSWIGDAAWTYSFGKPEPEVARLMACGKESLRRGIEQLQPGKPYLGWATAVQACVEREYRFHLVRGLGGHGYRKMLHAEDRKALHAPPYVSNVVPSYPGEWAEAFSPIQVGTLLAVEPMIAIGTGAVREHSGQWPILTADGSMSVHYEHDVLITQSGPRVLTAGLEKIPDVID